MSTAEILPLDDAHAPLTSPAVITVIGPVGPLICDGVPPNIAAKNPSRVAPTRPANAPILAAEGSLIPPKACIPKANANGNATMPAVRPPVKSPLIFFVDITPIEVRILMNIVKKNNFNKPKNRCKVTKILPFVPIEAWFFGCWWHKNMT